MKIIFLELFFKLSIGFFCFSILAKKIDKTNFGDFLFWQSMFSYGTVVINSTFDSLINKNLSQNNKSFYDNAFSFKLVLFIIISIALYFFSEIDRFFFLLIFLGALFGLVVEHQDVLIRYREDYRSYRYKMFLILITSPGKIAACFYASIDYYLIVSVFEVAGAFFVNKNYVKLKLIFSLKWVVSNILILAKTFFSGFFIFTFFRLDQFFVFGMMGAKEYSIYAVAIRFNEVLNSFVGLYSRLVIPRLYTGVANYKSVLIKILLFNFVIAIFSYPFVYLYVNKWLVNYSNSFCIYFVLSLSGFALVFGQVRGVFFIKNLNLMPDIYNAVFGMLVFGMVIFLAKDVTSSTVAIAYLLGFIASGVISTVFYKTGYRFLNTLRKVK